MLTFSGNKFYIQCRLSSTSIGSILPLWFKSKLEIISDTLIFGIVLSWTSDRKSSESLWLWLLTVANFYIFILKIVICLVILCTAYAEGMELTFVFPRLGCNHFYLYQALWKLLQDRVQNWWYSMHYPMSKMCENNFSIS